MADVHIFYGGRCSGKTHAMRQLAEELRDAHGWESSYYCNDSPVVKAVTIVEAEPIGTAAFNMIASGEPIFGRRSLHGEAQTTTARALIVSMMINDHHHSPISPNIDVSLVAKLHALQALNASRIQNALLILKRLNIPPIAIDTELIYKIWLIQQLSLPLELCTRVAKFAIKDSLSARLTANINRASQTRQEAKAVALLMNATITATDLVALPRHGRDYYGVLAAA